jgi:hypothetical protein
MEQENLCEQGGPAYFVEEADEIVVVTVYTYYS